MSKQVKCISPHGGCHNGMDQHGHPVHPKPVIKDGQVVDSYLPETDPAALRLPPNEGGWIMDGRIPGRHAAVGQVYEVGDDFVADGFHWEDVESAPQSDPSPAETATEGDGE